MREKYEYETGHWLAPVNKAPHPSSPLLPNHQGKAVPGSSDGSSKPCSAPNGLEPWEETKIDAHRRTNRYSNALLGLSVTLIG